MASKVEHKTTEKSKSQGYMSLEVGHETTEKNPQSQS